MPDSTTNETKTPEQKKPESDNVTPIKPEEKKLDDNGYQVTSEEKKPEEKKPEESIKPVSGYTDETKEENIEPKIEKIDPVSGYAEKVEKKPEEKKPEEKKVEEKPEEKKTSFEEMKLDTEGLLDQELKSIGDFVKKHGVNKDQAQELVDIKKAEIKLYTDEQKNQKIKHDADRKQLRADWKQELKDDPKFGGEKFDHSIQQSEKVLHEFFPGLKKILTERGGMLPPYVMRDLAKLAGHLYSSEKLVQGDPSVPPKKEEVKEDDPLAFYNS